MLTWQIAFCVVAFVGYTLAVYQMGWTHGRSRGKQEQAEILAANGKKKGKKK